MLSLPNFLIIGAMRSGTTSLVSYLRKHDDVFLASRKEVHFFDHRYNEGLEWYSSFFAGSEAKPARGEATPNYLYDRMALSRIRESIPGVKLITVLRDPADRAYSHYWHNRSRGKEPLSFGEALALESQRLRASADDATTYSYLDRGRYGSQLSEVVARFPLQSLWVGVFDDLVSAPSKFVDDVCSFLGVGALPQASRVGDPVNRYIEFRSKTVRRLSRKWPPAVRKVVARLNVKTNQSYPPLSADSRQQIYALLHDEIQLASSILGRDLTSVWRTGGQGSAPA